MTSNPDLKRVMSAVRKEISKVVIGQREVVEKCLIVIFCGRHGLIEGVPGIAKTLLVRTLARILGGEFNRIQFTPDLMPADITGTNVFNLKANQFKLLKGPVFTTFLLADEINRAPAKTQSALLQAMQERAVTIDRETHRLSPNFTVFATQNPIEYEGTYPLPEAQKDRFMLKINMDYPAEEEETLLARRMMGEDEPERVLDSGRIRNIIEGGQLIDLKESLGNITIREELLDYLVRLVRTSRRHESVMVGAGPRATQALLMASRAKAALEDRDFVIPDDIKSLAGSVFGHRLILRPEYELEGLTVGEVVDQILREVAVPR